MPDGVLWHQQVTFLRAMLSWNECPTDTCVNHNSHKSLKLLPVDGNAIDYDSSGQGLHHSTFFTDICFLYKPLK